MVEPVAAPYRALLGRRAWLLLPVQSFSHRGPPLGGTTGVCAPLWATLGGVSCIYMEFFANPTAFSLARIQLAYKSRARVLRLPFVLSILPLLQALVRVGVIQAVSVQVSARVSPARGVGGSFLIKPWHTSQWAPSARAHVTRRAFFGPTHSLVSYPRASQDLEYVIFLKYINGEPAVGTIRNY